MNYTVHQFSRPEYQSGYTFPSPGDLPDPELESGSPTLQVLYQLSHRGSPRILEWVAYPFYRGLSYPGIKLGSPASQADSLPTELSGKLKKRKMETYIVLMIGGVIMVRYQIFPHASINLILS